MKRLFESWIKSIRTGAQDAFSRSFLRRVKLLDRGSSERIRVLVWFVVLGMATYVIASHYVVESVQVVGPSMAPTLGDSKMYYLNHFVYLYRSPHPGDIVVIRDPSDGLLSVKRIVARPGDTIGFVDGKVVVNGTPLKESYL